MVDEQTLRKFKNRFEPSLQMMSSIYLGDYQGTKPSVKLTLDEPTCYDPNNNTIYINVKDINNYLDIDSYEDFVEAVNYLYGHEEQHLRSTVDSDYSWAVQRGCEVIIEYFASQLESTTKRFKNSHEYVEYLNNDLPANHRIYMSYSMLQSFVLGLVNSIEDGRIENIRPAKFYGFAALRKKFRARVYLKSNDTYGSDPKQKLRCILNNILMLATSQMYEMGFKKNFAGTQIERDLKQMMPYIYSGIVASSCMQMAKNAVKVCEIAAPYFFEYSKCIPSDEYDKRKELEELISKLITQEVRNGRMKATEEKQKNNAVDSLFTNSDLEVTLPDDVYDELTKNKSNNSGNGMMIKREHPKDECSEEETTESTGSNNSDGESNESSSTLPSESKEATNNVKSEENGGCLNGQPVNSEVSSNKNDSSSTEDDSEKKSTDNENGSCNDEAMAESSSSLYQESDKDLEEKKQDQAGASGKTQDSTKQSGGIQDGNIEDDIAKIKAEMEAASKEVRQNTFEQINTSDEINRKRNPKKTEKISGGKGNAIEANGKTMKDICSSFEEMERDYKLTDNLPPVLEQRGKAFKRSCDRFLRSRSVPNLTRLNSGSIDASLITGLAYGDTEIFKKKGKSKTFDGAVYILIDNSGSMSGEKRKSACAAASIIETGFSQFMPTKIVAFDSCSCVVHEKIKDWEETSKRSMSWNFYLHGREGGGNEDGYDIKIATRELLSRAESSKLLVILSDGAPRNRSLVTEAVKSARKKGIKLAAIYFEEGEINPNSHEVQAFFNMYDNKDCIACSHTEIEKNLVKIVKDFSRQA
ncbi:MAG: VWA domain-containing protein [Lachnospiraceae bacterium]|nr:VWA domain-containing protein [Lachnospiraceae bacterium]